MTQKTFNLKFKTNFESNGFPSGLIMKRDLTFREANHLASSLLGINTSLTFDDCLDDKAEKKEMQQKLIEDITKLIKGNTGFDWISEEWANGEACDDLNITLFIPFIDYLIKKGIIE
jgi:hypothetical protein